VYEPAKTSPKSQQSAGAPLTQHTLAAVGKRVAAIARGARRGVSSASSAVCDRAGCVCKEECVYVSVFVCVCACAHVRVACVLMHDTKNRFSTTHLRSRYHFSERTP
jgi:hypothetical protein